MTVNNWTKIIYNLFYQQLNWKIDAYATWVKNLTITTALRTVPIDYRRFVILPFPVEVKLKVKSREAFSRISVVKQVYARRHFVSELSIQDVLVYFLRADRFRGIRWCISHKSDVPIKNCKKLTRNHGLETEILQRSTIWQKQILQKWQGKNGVAKFICTKRSF